MPDFVPLTEEELKAREGDLTRAIAINPGSGYHPPHLRAVRTALHLYDENKRLACGHLASGARPDGRCFYATCPGRGEEK